MIHADKQIDGKNGKCDKITSVKPTCGSEQASEKMRKIFIPLMS